MPYFGGKINEPFYVENASNFNTKTLQNCLVKIFIHFQDKMAYFFLKRGAKKRKC